LTYPWSALARWVTLVISLVGTSTTLAWTRAQPVKIWLKLGDLWLLLLFSNYVGQPRITIGLFLVCYFDFKRPKSWKIYMRNSQATIYCNLRPNDALDKKNEENRPPSFGEKITVYFLQFFPRQGSVSNCNPWLCNFLCVIFFRIWVL